MGRLGRYGTLRGGGTVRAACALLVLAVAGTFAPPAHGEDFPLPRGTAQIGLRSGFATGVTKSVTMAPVSLRLGYVLYQGKPWLFPRGALEVATEPFVSPITSVRPGTSGSIEIGLGLPMFAYHFNLGNRLVPYIEGGVGLLYTDLRGFHLGGHFQFLSQGGMGVNYFLTDNTALNLGWRFRHISNAGIDGDNVGLNTYTFQAGVSYFLPAR